MSFDLRSRSRALVLVTGSIVVLLGISVPSASAATTSVDCAADPDALQPALDAAEWGDVIDVTGTCVGTFTVGTSLTLRGRGTLDGRGAGPVLYVDAFTDTSIEDLRITGGDADAGGGVYVEFFATVRLHGASSVRGNAAQVGGGVFVAGFLEMNDRSSVRGNSASIAGGGIYDRSGVVMNDASSVGRNTAPSGGGVYVVEFRGLALHDAASIARNRAARGGGISASLDTEVSLSDRASVTGNVASEIGGGIESAGSLQLAGSASVRGNTAGTEAVGGRGGGIASTAVVTLIERSRVQANQAIGPGADDGGIYHVCDPFTVGDGVHLDGGRVQGNRPNDIVSLHGDCV